MKKIMFFAIFAFAGLFISQASANSYQLDNAAVDQMFAQAEVVDFFAAETMAPLAESGYSSNAQFVDEKDPLVAFLLSWFLGYLGIHRAYLGTSTGTIVGYILTLGGCGIVATIDWIMLLIGLVNNDISQYIDNPKFFMW
jgi:TM2 domain-containing membrane protein YozV